MTVTRVIDLRWGWINSVFFYHLHFQYQETSEARIVFGVTLEGSARKLITVHSALTIVSGLSVPMELKLMDPGNPASKIFVFL